jgi:hypothetical protein
MVFILSKGTGTSRGTDLRANTLYEGDSKLDAAEDYVKLGHLISH